jgi:hypothetical protein
MTTKRRPRRLTPADLDTLILKAGVHNRRNLDSLCLMEAVAWFAGQPHTDHPPCVSPVISGFLRSWNDAMSEDDRQQLKPLIPLVIDTAATPEIEMRQSWLALDWYCRVSTPAWLRLAGLTAEAEAIEATAPIVDAKSARDAQDALDTARRAARDAARDAAWDAAWDAVWAAARDAAWDAAWTAAWAAAGAAAWTAAWAAAGDAARDAAGAAAWAAARDAARDAAWTAAWDAAGDAARDAAWTAAWDAAGDAAWDAARDAARTAARTAARDAAGDAAGDAARDQLRPTVLVLQASALSLVERLIAVGQDGPS